MFCRRCSVPPEVSFPVLHQTFQEIKTEVTTKHWLDIIVSYVNIYILQMSNSLVSIQNAPQKQRPKSRKYSKRVEATDKSLKRIKRVPVTDIVNIFCDHPSRGEKQKTQCSARRCLMEPATNASEAYPKNYTEFVKRLESSNQRKPANIPVLITTDYTPHKQFKRSGVIAVKKGNIVNAIYKSQDWIYVITAADQSGYVPYECLDPIGLKRPSHDFAQQFPDPVSLSVSLPTDVSCMSGTTGSPFPSPSGDSQLPTTLNESVLSNYQDTTLTWSEHSRPSASDDSGIHDRIEDSHEDVTTLHHHSPCIVELCEYLDDSHIYENLSDFRDDALSDWCGDSSGGECRSGDESTRLTVIFDYVPIHDYDVPVKHQEVVDLIHDGEKDWVWVEKDDGSRGFIPRKYAIDLTTFNLDPETKTTYL